MTYLNVCVKQLSIFAGEAANVVVNEKGSDQPVPVRRLIWDVLYAQ